MDIKPRLWWFTEDDGEICLGTEPSALASIVYATGIVTATPVLREATEAEFEALSALGEFNTWNADQVAIIAKTVK